MGGKISKARRACTSSTNVSGYFNMKSGGSLEKSKVIDTACVQSVLSK